MREGMIELLHLAIEVAMWVGIIGIAVAPIGQLILQVIDDLKQWRRKDDDV